MRLYGEANNLPGLATGPIETRFSRLRQHAAADDLVVWTTPTRWAAGEGLSLRVPALRLEFACELTEGHLAASKVSQVSDELPTPDREQGAVGLLLNVEHVLLPPEQEADSGKENGVVDPGVLLVEGHFARLGGRRWGGFVEPLRLALEAEAEDDEERTRNLTTRYGGASLVRTGDEDLWKLTGVSPEAVRAYDEGEWLEVMDGQGRSIGSARVVHQRASEGSLEVGIRGTSDPPKAGFVRPRSRRKILDQKRALLDELESPTGSLPHLVRLVAAPSSLPAPHPERPTHFVNSAVLRNRSQARAVALALGLEEGQALLIQGPPGTGKSTTAAEIDVQLIQRDPAVRILVCSHSNHGTDNMLMKVLPYLEDAADRIARVGFFDRIAREARPFYAAPDADLGDRNIVFTTIDALALQDIAGATLYDYVILDEANRAGVLDSLLALARGSRMILVGDAMQLQPVMSEAEQKLVASQVKEGGRKGRQAQAVIAPRAGAENVIGKSLFAWLLERRFSPPAAVLLDQQNRMHPSIGELVSRVFYGGKVRTGPAAPRRGTGLPLFPQSVTWVDTRSLHGNKESRAGGTSLFNVAEGRLVTSITRYVATHAPANLTIGVIAAYAEQRELLRRMIGPRSANGVAPERQLEIDTVDAFEGREKDIIILSLVRTNKRRDVGFLRLEQRLNVAVSRARRLILVVGDTATLRGGYFSLLINTTQAVGQILAAPKVAAQLSGRGRRTRVRDDRRRERPSEAPTDAGVPAEEGPEDGPRRAPATPSRRRAPAPPRPAAPARAAPRGGSSPPDPGEETPRRRRRRRAWERRRDRLRESGHLDGAGDDQGTLMVDGVAPGEDGGYVFSPDDEAPAYQGIRLEADSDGQSFIFDPEGEDGALVSRPARTDGPDQARRRPPLRRGRGRRVTEATAALQVPAADPTPEPAVPPLDLAEVTPPPATGGPRVSAKRRGTVSEPAANGSVADARPELEAAGEPAERPRRRPAARTRAALIAAPEAAPLADGGGESPPTLDGSDSPPVATARTPRARRAVAKTAD